MTSQHAHHNHGDTTGVHGMLLFGEETIYLSHLPMFSRLHRFHVLVEVSFADDVSATLAADRKDAGGEIYTFVPEPFAMDGSTPTSLDGTIFHGHFERGGRPIAEGVTANIERVACFRPLDLDAEHDDSGALTYLCFGRPEELFLAHQITARPDFDHILTARLVPGTIRNQMGNPLPDDDLHRAFTTAVPVQFGRADTIDARLTADESLDGLFITTSSASAHGFIAEVKIDREIYLEIDELG